MSVSHRIELAMASLLFSASAYTCTTITSLPYSIAQSGRYCLASSLTSSTANGVQISIGAGDVDLDLSGYRLRCTLSSQNAINGTSISNVRVHGGSIVGCNFAVALRNCSGCYVRDLTLLNNAVGISVSGDGARIESNLLRNDNPNAGRPGIQLDAYSSVVQDNLISGAFFALDVNGKENLIRSNHFAACGTAVRFFAPATYQSILVRCVASFAGPAIGSSTDAGGNH